MKVEVVVHTTHFLELPEKYRPEHPWDRDNDEEIAKMCAKKLKVNLDDIYCVFDEGNCPLYEV